MIIHKLPTNFVNKQFDYQPVGYFDVSLFRNVGYLNRCEEAIKTGNMIVLDFKNLDKEKHDFWGTYLKMFGDNLTFKDYQAYCTLPEIKSFRDSRFMELFQSVVETTETLKTNDILCFELDEPSRNATLSVIQKLQSSSMFKHIPIMIELRDPKLFADIASDELINFDVLTDLAFHSTKQSLRINEFAERGDIKFKFHEVFDMSVDTNLLDRNIKALNKLAQGQEVDYKDFV